MRVWCDNIEWYFAISDNKLAFIDRYSIEAGQIHFNQIG